MTALELYQEDRQSRKGSETRRGSQEYFILLRDALYGELTDAGRSDFLEEMIRLEGRDVPALAFAALRECYAAIVDGRRMKDASSCVPHLLKGQNMPMSWAEMDAGADFRVNDPQLRDMLPRLRYISWQLVSARDQAPSVDEKRAASREVEGFRAVSHALEKDNVQLRAERDELRRRVTELEEGVISRQLQTRVDARRYQLEDELRREMDEKRLEMERAMQQALAHAVQEDAKRREAAWQQAAEQDQRRAAGYEGQRAEMQAFFRTQMEEFLGRLGGEDHRFLAQSYAELRGVLTRELPGILAGAQVHGADNELLEALAGLNATVNDRMHRVEQALAQLGLQVFFPQEGAPFDEAAHSPEHASGVMDGCTQEVAAVLNPGVRFVHAGGQSDTIVRALVQTRRVPGMESDE